MFIETLDLTFPLSVCKMLTSLESQHVPSSVEIPASVRSYGCTQNANIQICVHANQVTFKVDGVSSDCSIIEKKQSKILKLCLFDCSNILEQSGTIDRTTAAVTSIKRRNNGIVSDHSPKKKSKGCEIKDTGLSTIKSTSVVLESLDNACWALPLKSVSTEDFCQTFTFPSVSTNVAREASTFPSASTNVARETSTFPSASTNVARETSTLLSVSTDNAHETSAFPPVSTNVPRETSTLLSASTNVAREISTFPSVSTNVACETSTLPSVSTDDPQETFTVKSEPVDEISDDTHILLPTKQESVATCTAQADDDYNPDTPHVQNSLDEEEGSNDACDEDVDAGNEKEILVYRHDQDLIGQGETVNDPTTIVGSQNSTARSTMWAVNVLRQWLADNGRAPDFESLSVPELNDCLKSFYSGLKTDSGIRYPRATIVGLRSSLSRHLLRQPHGRNVNIIHDPNFDTANKAFKAMELVSEVVEKMIVTNKRYRWRVDFKNAGFEVALPSAEPTSAGPTKKKRCTICPRHRDRKGKIVCVKCSKSVCREHSVIVCENCSSF